MDILSALQSIGIVNRVGNTLANGLDNVVNRLTGGESSTNNDSAQLSQDSVILSRIMSKSNLSSALGVEPREDGMIHIEDIISVTAEDISAFRAALGKICEENGIELGDGVQLKIGSRGEVVVSGDPEAKAKMEQVFRENPDMANQLSKISANLSLIHAAQEAEEFQAAYRQNPEEAISRFGYLLDDDRKKNVTFSVTDDSFESMVNGQVFNMEE